MDNNYLNSLLGEEKESRLLYESHVEGLNNKKIYSILNEAYIGKTQILQQIEEQIGAIRIKTKYNSDFDRLPEVQKLNRLVEEQFGMDIFALHMVHKNEINAYTHVIARNFDVYRLKNFSSYVIGDRKTGYRFKKDNGFCIMVTFYYGLFMNPDLSDAEILAIMLHEIGHNFADFIDNQIKFANQSIMDDYLAVKIMNILTNVIKSDVLLDNIGNVLYGDMTNAYNTKEVNKEKNQAPSTMAGNAKGIGLKVSGFFDVCAGILSKYNIITLGIAKFHIFLRKPYEDTMKKSALISVKRKNEIIADKFCAIYGYGPELGSGLQKTDNYITKEDEIISKLPFGKKFIEAWDMLYLNINEFDCHPHNIQRINACISVLEEELKKQDLDPKIKKEIEAQIKDMKAMIMAVKKEVDANPNNYKAAYDAYVADKLPAPTTKKIEQNINDELDIALECYNSIYKNPKAQYVSEGFKESLNDSLILNKYYIPILTQFKKRISHDSSSDYHYLVIVNGKTNDNYYIIDIYGIFGSEEAKKYVRKNINIKNGELYLSERKAKEKKSIHITIMDKYTNIPKIENSGLSDRAISDIKKELNKYNDKIIKISN